MKNNRLLVCLLVVICSLAGCDELKQALGQVVVSVENLTNANGFEISANGESRFTLDAGQKKSFSVSGASTGSIRIVASHPALSSDLIFTVLAMGNDGGSAALVLSTEQVSGVSVVRLTCPGCERLFGLQEGTPKVESGNPVK